VPVRGKPSLSMRRATPVYKTCTVPTFFFAAIADWARSLAIAVKLISRMGLALAFAAFCQRIVAFIILWSVKGRLPMNTRIPVGLNTVLST